MKTLLLGKNGQVGWELQRWHDDARDVIGFTKDFGEELAVSTVNPINTTACPTRVCRPLNSRLSTQKPRDNFYLHLPDWQSGVIRMLREVLNK